MSVESNKAAAQTITDMFAGKVPATRAAEFIAPGAVDHQGLQGVDTDGPEGFQRIVAVFKQAFPDMALETRSIIGEGDLVASHFRMTATNTGDFMGMPATNKQMDVEGMDLIRFGSDGKAVEHWGFMEESKMWQQLNLNQQPS